MSYQRGADSSSSGGPGCIIGAVAVALAVIVGLIFGGAYFAGYNSSDAGHTLVVRNGGWFSGKNISKVIPAGSGQTSTGMFTTVHAYPVPQQQYTITADAANGAKSGADVVTVPSSDGVQMDIEGTLYYTLDTFDKGAKDPYATLKQFDDNYGIRDFTFDGVTKHPWQGADGWNVFMNTVVRNTVNEALRKGVGGAKCSELIASCALVQNSGGAATNGVPTGTSKLSDVQDSIDGDLQTYINANLGGAYFTNIKFVISGVKLPTNVQDAVNAAQAEFAKVSTIQAQVAQAQEQVKLAQQQAAADLARQQGYTACPICGQIDLMKAIPPTITTYAPGAPVAIK